MDIADIYALIVCLGLVAAFSVMAVKVGGWWGVALLGFLAALFVCAFVMGHRKRSGGRS